MSGAKAGRKKQSFWQTLRAASGPYRRLLGYVKPYRVRFILGLLLGFAYGGVSALLPLAIAILEASSVSQDSPYNQIESNTAIEMPMLRGEPHDGLD